MNCEWNRREASSSGGRLPRPLKKCGESKDQVYVRPCIVATYLSHEAAAIKIVADRGKKRLPTKKENRIKETPSTSTCVGADGTGIIGKGGTHGWAPRRIKSVIHFMY